MATLADDCDVDATTNKCRKLAKEERPHGSLREVSPRRMLREKIEERYDSKKLFFDRDDD